jgi:hypothetical protein
VRRQAEETTSTGTPSAEDERPPRQGPKYSLYNATGNFIGTNGYAKQIFYIIIIIITTITTTTTTLLSGDIVGPPPASQCLPGCSNLSNFSR